MPFPPGVTLCEVRLPASATWQGGSSAISLTLTPTREVFNRKSGELLAPISGNGTGPSGAGVLLLVPHGQQAGYRDAVGNSIGNWEYDVLATYRDAANVAQTLRKQVRIPRGTTSLDVLAAVDYEPTSDVLGLAPRLGIDSDGTPYVIS
jgi:hypothetical protein